MDGFGFIFGLFLHCGLDLLHLGARSDCWLAAAIHILKELVRLSVKGLSTSMKLILVVITKASRVPPGIHVDLSSSIHFCSIECKSP